jgi:tricorn protease
MWWDGRVYFVSDRDGTMNVWSMNPKGGELRQHTRHKGWDVKSPSLWDGGIVYQLGADLRWHDIRSGRDEIIPLTLASDFDHQREKWVKKPMDFVTSAQFSPNGDRVVMTARGQVFVAPSGPGRLVEVTRQPSVRYRLARFMPDGKSLLALSDESGEVEFVTLPANGVGSPTQLTSNGTVLRWEGVPSPDGKWVAHHDKNQELWILNLERKENKRIASSPQYNFADLAWSPDSQWLAYIVSATNQYWQIWLYRPEDGQKVALTSSRVNSISPAWSPDGKWIYFISERHLESLVPSPWGPRQPEPFFDRQSKIYLVSLTADQRSPFEPPDELHPAEEKKEKDSDKEKGKDKAKDQEKDKDTTSPDKDKSTETKDRAGRDGAKDTATAGAPATSPSTNPPPKVRIELEGLASRLWEVPVPAGNYTTLTLNDKRLFWVSRETTAEGKRQLMTLEITNDDPKPKTLVEEIKGYELSRDGKKLLVHKGDNFHIEDAAAAPPAKLAKALLLKDWTFSLDPRDEWRQMFVEAWRLERDYFYDRQMHGVDWPGILKKYSPLVERVTDRAELSDLVYEMVGELSALHIIVTGGDHREAPDRVKTAGLGAALSLDRKRGGWRIDHIFRADPDYPNRQSPLARPGLGIKEGDVIESINGAPTLATPPGALLRNQGGKQVLLRLRSPNADKSRDAVVKPIDDDAEMELRYGEWELTRRERVEEAGRGDIGYVHLRAMGKDDIGQWAREYYPIFDRRGLIIDVRHNNGGNIDSWILEKLLRKAWFYWQGRAGVTTWNMQYAFRGHIVVLCDEHTASDGEAFTEGFKRLGLGKVIGQRTWGGEIWLTGSNGLVDRGIATAAEFGVYGPEGKWLIENHGVEPDIIVENPPHATFQGEDAQLARAIAYLQEEIRHKPVDVPPVPRHPDKSFK